MRIAVTGAAGMLGKDLLLALKDNCSLIPCTRKEFDFTDRFATLEYLKNNSPEVIVHCAAYTNVDASERDPDPAYQVNGQGSLNMALVAREINAFLVYVSTDYVFNGEKSIPYREEDSCDPLNVYGLSKWQGEKNIQATLSDYLIVRTSWLFGKHGNNFVSKILNKTKEQNTLNIVNDQRGSPTYTKDLSYAIKNLLEVEARGIVHVSNSGECSWYEFVREIMKLTGKDNITVNPVSSKEFSSPVRRPAYSVLDGTRYSKLTGLPLRPWNEALKEYLREL